MNTALLDKFVQARNATTDPRIQELFDCEAYFHLSYLPQLTRQVYEKVLPFDISEVKEYLVTREGMERQEVETLEPEYKKFLALCVTGNAVPTEKIDAFWHAHILHTGLYKRMCDTVFGGHFIHHQPGGEKETLLSMFRGMLERYKQAFGEPQECWNMKGISFGHSECNSPPCCYDIDTVIQ
jgi:hypothetical protein